MMIGLANDVKTTQNGYTFMIEDIDGKTTKCFNTAKPSENEIYLIKGTYSDDSSMFFVRSMQPINHNEF